MFYHLKLNSNLKSRFGRFFLVQSIFACSISFKFCKRNIRAHTLTAFLSHCINFATCTTTFNLNNLILQNTYITIHQDSHDKLQLSKKIKRQESEIHFLPIRFRLRVVQMVMVVISSPETKAYILALRVPKIRRKIPASKTPFAVT